MDDFVQNVLTQDQRGNAANHAMNATKQNAVSRVQMLACSSQIAYFQMIAVVLLVKRL